MFLMLEISYRSISLIFGTRAENQLEIRYDDEYHTNYQSFLRSDIFRIG